MAVILYDVYILTENIERVKLDCPKHLVYGMMERNQRWQVQGKGRAMILAGGRSGGFRECE